MKKLNRNQLLFSYGKKNGKTMLLGLIFSILAMLTDLLGPYILGRLIDNELVDGLGAKSLSIFIGLLAIYFLANLLSSAFSFAYSYFFNKAANKIAMDMQKDLFAHIQDLPISYYDSIASGQIVSRISTDTRDVKDLFRLVLSQIFIAILYAIGIYLTLFKLDKRLFLLGLVPIPIIILITIDFKNKAKKYNYSQRRSVAKFGSDLKEDIEGMDIIRAYNEEEFIYDELDQINRDIYKDGLAYTVVFSYSGNNAMESVRNISLGLALLIFGYSAITGNSPSGIGMFYAFSNYMTQLFAELRIVVLRAGELEKSFSAADHIFELFQLKKEDFGKNIVREVQGEIDFEDISFSYDGENYVLKDIDFHVDKGEQIAVVGQTGSGKSTIMNLLFGFYHPQKGRVLVDGMDLEEYDKRQIRSSMSIVLQDSILFTASLRDNISLFNDSITDFEIKKALREVGGERILDKLDKGLDTKIVSAGDSFSAGEKQIISFARALVTNPKILVLDEATSNIDTETEAIIQEGIKALGKGRTMLIIAHRLSTIKHVDKIYVLSKGRIIEEGSHDDLIKQNGIYKEMYEAQSKEAYQGLD